MKDSNIYNSQLFEPSDIHNLSGSSDQNTQYKVNVLGFQELPRSKSFQWSDWYGSVIIPIYPNSNYTPEMFKCYKCYGIVQNKQTPSLRNCRQCHGTSYVRETNRLVQIFEQIIKHDFPQLSNKKQNADKRMVNLIQTIEKQYACTETIKEESFSMQEDQTPLCRSCFKECENDYHKCDRCTSYYICPSCFSNQLFYHPHRLFPRGIFLKIGDLNPPYIYKTLSEESKNSQTPNKSQDTFYNCKNCFKKVQPDYLTCSTCLSKGLCFILCDSCYMNKFYNHESDHQLTWINSRAYDFKADLNSYKEVQIDFKSIPWLRSHDSFSDKIKEVALQKNSSVNIQEQHPNNRSVVMIKADISQKSFLQSEIQHVGQLPLLKSKLSRSFQSFKEQQEDFSLRFSQNRNEGGLYNNLQFQQIHEEPSLEYNSLRYQRPKEQNHLSKHSYRKNKPKTDRSNPQEYLFRDYQCDFCKVSPIVNRKFHCNSCENFDLCENCYINNSSKHQHNNFRIDSGQQLRKQRQFLARSIHQKSVKANNSLFQISKRMAQSIQARKRVG